MAASPRNVYLNAQELDTLERLGDELGLSVSAVLRLGLRLIGGMPVPSRMRAMLELELDTHNIEGAPDETSTLVR